MVEAQVDAIVNAANRTLLGGGGVDGAIHRAAGTRLIDECRGLGGCATGETKVTGAYGISQARHVVHMVGPVFSAGNMEGCARQLASCYTRSCVVALGAGDTLIGFPAISRGAYGYPFDDAFRVALAALEPYEGRFERIVLAMFLEREFDRAIGMAASPFSSYSWAHLRRVVSLIPSFFESPMTVISPSHTVLAAASLNCLS